MSTATLRGRDMCRCVPGVQRRRRRFEARIPDGQGGRIYLGLYVNQTEAERIVINERRARGLRPYRYAA